MVNCASMGDDSVNELIDQLRNGARLSKQKLNGKILPREFFLHQQGNFISYRGSRKLLGKARKYHVSDIDEIRQGFHGQHFQQLLKRGKLRPADEKRAFSIFYDNHRKQIHLLATNQKTRDVWTQALEHLRTQHAKRTQIDVIQDECWILNLFHLADQNHSNTLSKEECRNLLADAFNVEMPDYMFNQMFHKAAKSKANVLTSDEFLQFFYLLARRNDLYEIMKKFTKVQPMEKICLTKTELISFLSDKSKDVDELINKYEMNKDFQKQSLLSLDGFRNMLLSENFNLIDLYYTRHVYQDMSRPLCDYYINTSHNTYLFYNQLTGDSDPEAYSQVLLMGCRAVELDCYDGDEDGPIVKHAYTLVKACSFRSIIYTIAPNLFKVSPYPVILNIENHCSSKQQIIMARILKEILGDQLLTKPIPKKNPPILPSPDDLKNKVLIRSKKTKETKLKTREDDDDFLLNPVTKNVEPELEELFIYLQNVPYLDYTDAKEKYSCFQSTSLAEGNFYEHAQNDPIGLVRQTNWRLLRIYPGSLRQDSSNLNPIHPWNFGIQLVALNHQNNDESIALSYGKFLDNGGCGYVLKPNYLLNTYDEPFNPFNPEKNFDDPIHVTIKIISGQFLPRSNKNTLDIPDSYVRISIHGLRCDEKTEQTKVINNNAFNPLWNETFQFYIQYPRLALVNFSVMDYDTVSHDDRLGYFCCPISLIRSGYRHIHLRANNNDPIQSTLFVHVNMIYENTETIIHTLL